MRINIMVLSRLLVSVFFVLVGTWNLTAEFTPRTFVASRTQVPPVLDGRLTELEWGTTQVIDRFYAYQSGGAPAAATGFARILWDPQYLYIGIHADDREIRSSCSLRGHCGNDASLFNGDVLEFFLKELPGRTKYFEFEWSPLGEIFDARFNNTQDPRWSTPPGVGYDAAILAGVSVDGTVDSSSTPDTGWTIEAAIPMSDLSLATVGEGSEWFFTVARYDYFNNPAVSTAALMMSTPGDPMAPQGGVTFGFHSYEIYDKLRLGSVPEPQLGFGILGIFVARFILRLRARP